MLKSIVATVPAAILLLGAVAGCASHPPAPVADLSRAHTLVAQAQSSDAPRYDSVDLTSAQDKLQEADANAQSKPAFAGQMAQEASADAELALARTSEHKAQESLAQVNDSLTALRQQTQQLDQNTVNTGASGPAVAPEAPLAPSTPQGGE